MIAVGTVGVTPAIQTSWQWSGYLSRYSSSGENSIRFVAGVRHSLHRTANGGFDHLHSLPSDYGQYEADWINRLAHTLPKAIADKAFEPDAAVPSIAAPAWCESPRLQLAALLLFAVAFAGYPLTAAIRRVRGRRGAPLVRHPARWLVGAGLVTAIGLLLP